ncbi:hypothetical protein SAMN02982917_0480 [Azospirillum oryzae]|uniref:Uncharacterized protein n=1 Tax=Azospirillum oryzae TaxID=286727 RepID=A0A1X7HSB8_9PROT|nr:hypothetical protein SAMN02982917_0480 [Azospirillum oryzae]
MIATDCDPETKTGPSRSGGACFVLRFPTGRQVMLRSSSARVEREAA